MEPVLFIPHHQKNLVQLAAESDPAPVLLLGGAGTGKGVIAEWIHSRSERKSGPFITTHLDRSLVSQIHSAQNGTVFITELGALPLSEQKLLLTILTEQAIPHPENAQLKALVNIRIMGATSQNLENRARGGLFNRELLDKLNVFRIEMPNLSDRKEEFKEIVTGILNEIKLEWHKEHIIGLSDETWKIFSEYPWPGNLRELRNILKIATLQARGNVVEALDLPKFDGGRINFKAKRDEFARNYLVDLLHTFKWDLDAASKQTGMSQEVLQHKMDRYGIEKQQMVR